MTIYTMPQRSEEWFAVRMGKFTANEFGILMPSTRQKPEDWNDTQMKIILRVAAERITGQPVDPGFTSKPMQWGIDHEDEARAAFEMATGLHVDQVGFVEADDWCGCSPDGLIPTDGGIELKCPNQDTHLRYLMDSQNLIDDYDWQCQGSMLFTGRGHWFLCSFDPRFPIKHQLVAVQIKRDEEKITKLDKRLDAAIDKAKEVINGIQE